MIVFGGGLVIDMVKGIYYFVKCLEKINISIFIVILIISGMGLEVIVVIVIIDLIMKIKYLFFLDELILDMVILDV